MTILQKYEIDDYVSATFLTLIQFAPGVARREEVKGRVKVIGYEWGWWLKPPQWIYTITCDCHQFTLRATEDELSDCKIRISGATAKVLTNETKKAMQ